MFKKIYSIIVDNTTAGMDGTGKPLYSDYDRDMLEIMYGPEYSHWYDM